MLKMTRLAGLAAVLFIAAAALVVPLRGAGANAARRAGRRAAAPPPTPARPRAGRARPPASAKATEVVDNPYGLEALWKGGDLVARITLAILVIMSMGSWYIIITKVYEQAR